MNNSLVKEEKEKVEYKNPHWPTSKSVQAFLVTIPPLYQVNVKTISPGESKVLYNKDWGYV